MRCARCGARAALAFVLALALALAACVRPVRCVPAAAHPLPPASPTSVPSVPPAWLAPRLPGGVALPLPPPGAEADAAWLLRAAEAADALPGCGELELGGGGDEWDAGAPLAQRRRRRGRGGGGRGALLLSMANGYHASALLEGHAPALRSSRCLSARYVLSCLDARAYRECDERSRANPAGRWHCHRARQTLAEGSDLFSGVWFAIGWHKFDLLHAVTQAGIDALFVDVDVVLAANPFAGGVLDGLDVGFSVERPPPRRRPRAVRHGLEAGLTTLDHGQCLGPWPGQPPIFPMKCLETLESRVSHCYQLDELTFSIALTSCLRGRV